nr:putative F-box protein At1g19160 [Ipomoea batatas]
MENCKLPRDALENCKLPRDALIEILSRISVKGLMRFKCVCNFFYTLIKRDRDFIHKHYEISRKKNDDFSVLELDASYCCLDGNYLYNLVYKESESDEIRRIKLDITNSRTRYVICCDGMLCLIFGRGDMIIHYSDGTNLIFDILIWNPFTRETKNLPSVKVPAIKKPVKYWITNGFGFGLSKNMSWKIVMLWYFQYPHVESKDSYEIVMVCSQIGDGSWGWRQIDEAPHVLVDSNKSFYLKGRYYWRSSGSSGPIIRQRRLVWFDFSDEIFGIIEFPSHSNVASVTIMNDNIALLSCRGYGKVGDCIEIWLMNGNASNIYWHKHASIDCTRSIDYHKYWTLKGNWNEVWKPIGIWKLGGRDQLLVCPGYEGHRSDNKNKGFIAYVISIDLVTQEWKFVYLTRDGRTINILSNSAGFVQVCSETNSALGPICIFPNVPIYARAFSESLKLLQ